jgi:hypothetical protein
MHNSMNYAEIITSQYLATLEMLKQTITECPEALWNNPAVFLST